MIGAKGESLGVLPLQEALKVAEGEGLSLVEVSSRSDPVVCKIMDLGKYKYQMQKKNHQIRKNQKIVLLKTIKIRPGIASGDLAIKKKRIEDFMKEGHKVRVIMMLRGRENMHNEIGQELMRNLSTDVIESCGATLEQEVKLEGRNITMTIAPAKK